MKLHYVPDVIKTFYPSLTWHKNRTEKILYITFDDGPVYGPTEFVLQTLAKYNAKATFFCVGANIAKNGHLFDEILNAGHTVGNHTYNHLKGRDMPFNTYYKNIRYCDWQLERRTGYKFRLFRPPYGRMKSSQLKALKKKYDIVMWDVLTYDFAYDISPQKCLQQSVRYTRPGAVILFHDSFKSWSRLSYVLPRYLEFFSKKGYKFHGL